VILQLMRRGTARFMGMPSYASCPYTADYDAELSEKALGLRSANARLRALINIGLEFSSERDSER